MKEFLLIALIVFLLIILISINYVESEKKKWEQKSFDEIFGEKWEEKTRNEEQKKREIIGKYYKIKEKIKQKGRKYSAKEWNKIEVIIAKKLGTNRQYIFKWMKELGLNQKQKKCYKSKTDEQKFEIIKKFIEMSNECKQKGRKYSSKEWDKNYAEICKKIGVSQFIITKCKKQFGIHCKLTEKEKMEKMKIYWQIKGENPKMSDIEIGKILKIHRKTISDWKKQFGEEMFLRIAGEENE